MGNFYMLWQYLQILWLSIILFQVSVFDVVVFIKKSLLENQLDKR